MQPSQSSPNTPMGQPISSDPKGAQYVPQPLNSGPNGSPGNKKFLLLIVAGVVGLVILLVGLFFWMSSSAKSAYVKDAATFKQDVKNARDAMNTELESKDISGSDVEAKAIFEDHGKKLEAIVAEAPKQPKVFGLIPVAVDGTTKEEVERVRKAAADYASALRQDYSVYNYYLQATEKFKPIKDLGTITAETEDKIVQLGQLWPDYVTTFKSLQPPAGLEETHAKVITSADAAAEKIKFIVDNYDTKTVQEIDKLMGEVKPLTQEVNTIFVKGVSDAAEKSYEDINAKYDALDSEINE